MSDNATSTSTKGNAVLEPSSTGNSSTLTEQLQIVKKKGAKPEPPVITAFKANSGLMSRVHNFLPEMARAEDALKARVAAGESVDLEDVSGTDKVIEMNVGILANEGGKGAEGTSDSDSDSSTSHDGDANNEYTSDSDLDSSSSDTTESSSSSASIKLKMPTTNQSSSKKRPLIEVLNDNENTNCDANDEQSSQGAGKSGKFGQ